MVASLSGEKSMILRRASLPLLALVWLAPAIALADPPATIDVDLGGGTKLALVLVPAGSFTEGSPPAEVGHVEDERAHRVTLGNDVYLGKFPVTRGQFARFITATGYRTEAEKGTSGGSGWDGTALVQRRDFTWKSPGFAQTDDHPVTIVTYDDALAFTGWLTRTAGRAFTLPSEAQWEHAYRAGTTTAYYAGTTDADALALGWFKPNSGSSTHPVGQKKANALGLQDLSGNVYQWCLDWYAPYGEAAAVDPVQTTPDASDKPRRVLRGGSWLKDAKSGRAAARYRNAPGSRNADNGFRVVAATSATAALPVPTATPPATPAPTNPSSSRPSAPEDHSTAGCFMGLGCLGTLGLMSWLLVVIFRGKRKSAGAGPGAPAPLMHRLARDGFWIDAPGHLVGSLVHYRFRDQNAQIHEGQVRLEGAPGGQYVYTGQPPLAVLALQIIEAARGSSTQPRSSWSSQQQQQRYGATSSQSNDDSTFRGYPSAY
jgi:formylglycine-generating enzyme required for sulfatase activity